MPSNNEDFNRVWKISDYGAVANTPAAGTSLTGGSQLFPAGTPTGVSTLVENGKVKPTPAIKAVSNDILNDPNAFINKTIDPKIEENTSLLDKGKSFLGNLFNTEDEADLRVGPVSLSGVESVWDGMLKSFNWGYDRLNQLMSAGVSGLPGGTRTLTWEEAGNVSTGQAIVAAMGATAGRVKRNEWQLGDIAYAPLSLVATGLSMIDPNNAAQAAGFDVAREEDKKAAFESGGAGQFFTGVTDTAINIFADPLIVAGKALKITRLKYIDRPLNEQNVANIISEIDSGKALSAAGQVDEMAPAARFVHEAITPRADGTRMTAREIALRDEIKWSGDAEGIADALATVRAGDYDSAALVMKAGYSDVDAFTELARRNVIAADTLAASKRNQLEMRLAQDPSKYTVAQAKAANRMQAAGKIYEQSKAGFDAGTVSKSDYDLAFKTYMNTIDDAAAIDNGVLIDPIMKPTQESMEWMSALVDQAARDYDWFSRSLAESKQGALLQADRGFASDTAVGKFVSQRRAKRARNSYERKSTAGQGAVSQDFFGKNRFQRTMRVWKRLSDETPAYYISFEPGVDQGREMGAFFDSLGMYSGEAKEVVDQATGATRLVGGIQGKDELFQEYVSAQARGEQVSGRVLLIQERVKRDMADFYGLDNDLVDALTKKAFDEYEKLKDSVTHTDGGFFPSKDIPDELSTLNLAPFLTPQLSNGTYLLPWDHFEKIVKNIQSGKVKNPTAQGLLTPGQELGQRLINANDLFQDFWRPAVLFRLGYTQRNVAEGMFRSIAFNGSLEPVVWAGKAALYSRQNFRKAQRAAKEAEKIKGQLDSVSDVSRSQFDGLVTDQRNIMDREDLLIGARSRLETNAARAAEANVSPNVQFRGDPKSGIVLSDDGSFQLQRITETAPQAEASWTRTTAGYEAEGVGSIAKAGSKWEFTNVADGSVTTFKTLKEAKAAVAANRGAETLVERWRVNQLDPTDSAAFIPGTKTFATADEATAAFSQGIEDVFLGKAAAAGPQLEIIAKNGERARSMKPGEFIDPDTGKAYRSVDEIDADLDALRAQRTEIETKIDSYGGRPVPEALKGTKFQNWRDTQLKGLDEQIDGDEAYIQWIREFAKDADQELDSVQLGNLKFIEDQLALKKSQRVALERDDYFAMQEYVSQASARRRVTSGSRVDVSPGVFLNDAYGNPRYREIAWKNMSSDNTVKATLAARMQLADSIVYKKRFAEYVDVVPSDGQAYWDGMAAMLQQYSQSAMGRMIVKGDSDEKIALWLLNTREGQKTRDALDEAFAFAVPDAATPRIGADLDRAIAFAQQTRQGLEFITAGNKDVWKIVGNRPPSPEELKNLMSGMDNLAPVVGYKDEITGYNKFLDMYRKVTQRAFREIGTKPEDAFVRGPFYAKRYQVTRDAMLARLKAQYDKAEDIPIEYVLNVEKNAHRRALKDTKDWLYTIDRRTNLGKYGEIVFPFVSATQNSLTTVGRLTRRDPALPGIMLALWNAPSKVGWEDQEGRLIIPLPTDLIPDGIEDAFGIKGMKNITINKGSLNVIFPETGFAFVPRPAPLVQVAASELMKNGLFGQFGVEAPPLLTAMLGAQDADKLWGSFKDYLYGEENGLSAEFLSFDKILPPIANKMFQYMKQDGSSQYSYQYGIQARTQDLLWRAGERDDYPTAEEIINRTNGNFILRMLGNAFAFTPPAYQSPVEPLMELQRKYDEVYGLEGPLKFSEKFGSEMLILSQTETTENVGGALSNPGTLRNIRKYDGLLRELAPIVGEDLDVMGIFVNEDMAVSGYDANAYRWMTQAKIPGTSRNWRELNSGAEGMAEAQRQAGWVEYIKFKGQLDAILQQRGLSSYRVKGAEDLNTYRKEFVDNMMQNPNYGGWAVDFQSMGSSKTYSAVNAIQKALSNEDFMKDKQNSRTWQIAAMYMDTRNRLMDMVEASGVTLENDLNSGLKAEWDAYRQNLINSDIGWANIANRYLNGDDNPKTIGATFGGSN